MFLARKNSMASKSISCLSEGSFRNDSSLGAATLVCASADSAPRRNRPSNVFTASLSPTRRKARGSAHRAGVCFAFGIAGDFFDRAVGSPNARRNAISSGGQDGGEFCFGADHQSPAVGFFHLPFGDWQRIAGRGKQG